MTDCFDDNKKFALSGYNHVFKTFVRHFHSNNLQSHYGHCYDVIVKQSSVLMLV